MLQYTPRNPYEEVDDDENDNVISIMNKSQEMTFFYGRQKLTSTMKQGLEK